MQVMQILIELDRIRNFGNLTDEDEKAISSLLDLLTKIRQEGYLISLPFEIDIKDKDGERIGAIDDSNDLPIDWNLAKDIYRSQQIFCLISVNERVVVFLNRPSVAICFCQQNKVRPLYIEDVLKNFDSLIKNEDQKCLDALYHERYMNFKGVMMLIKPNK